MTARNKNIPALRFKEFNKDWDTVQIGDVFTFKQGVQCSIEGQISNPESGYIRFIRIVDLTKNDEPLRYIKDPGSEHHVSDEDLFMVRYGNPGVIGYGYEGVIANNLFRIIPLKKNISTKFYSYIFLNKKSELDMIASSSTMPALNFSSLRTIKLSSPQFPEQQKIASFLSTIDEKIRQLNRRKELLEQYKKGVMQQLFSGKLRFKDEKGKAYPKWEEKRLGDILNNKSAKYNPQQENTTYKCIELEHLSSNTGMLLGYTDSSSSSSIKNKFKKGYVLFGKLRPYLRKFLIAPFDGVCSSEIWVLTGKGILNDFVYRIIQTESFIELANQSTGSKMPRADWNVVSSKSFNIPSLPEQQKIASFLSSIDSKIESVTAQIERTQRYKKGLLQKMFV